ncbi:MAG: 50S ribosomal protein L14e [Desulfurococcaceae archaeon TW002]
MPAIEIGRVCVKLCGREAGRKCVVVDIIDENFVLVTGPKNLSGVKRRKVNVNHIEPTDKKIDIRKGATDEEVLEAIKTSGLESYMTEKAKVTSKELLYIKTLKTVSR